MKEIKDKIFELISDDAQIPYTPSLGYYLGQTGTIPYGIFYMNPPKEPTFPLVVYAEQTDTRDKRYADRATQMFETLFVFWVYGENKELIIDRIFHLLDGYKFGNVDRVTGTDYCIVLDCEEEWKSPDMFDEDFREFFKQVRYRIKYRRFPT